MEIFFLHIAKYETANIVLKLTHEDNWSQMV